MYDHVQLSEKKLRRNDPESRGSETNDSDPVKSDADIPGLVNSNLFAHELFSFEYTEI